MFIVPAESEGIEIVRNIGVGVKTSPPEPPCLPAGPCSRHTSLRTLGIGSPPLLCACRVIMTSIGCELEAIMMMAMVSHVQVSEIDLHDPERGMPGG